MLCRRGFVVGLCAIALTVAGHAADTPTTAGPTPAKLDEIFPGTGRVLGKPAPRKPQRDEQPTIALNFVNSDIRDVAKAILGDYLHLNYELAPDLKGTVTIQTSQPLTRSQVMPIFDQLLRLNGMAVVLSNDVYRVVPVGQVGPTVGPAAPSPHDRRGLMGYGIEVVPIKYISASEMQKLLAPLAPSQGIVHVDTARNILIIEGTQEERQTILDDIALFDVDWMAGMSFAIFNPTYIDADELDHELSEILGKFNSPVANVVRLVPIGRLNVLLAISTQRRYLDQLQGWVDRLDRPGQGSERRVYIYHVQNGRAADLAATLNRIYGGAHEAGAPYPPSTGPDQPSATPSTGVAGSPPPENNAPPPPSGNTETAAGGPHGLMITTSEPNNALVIYASPQEYLSLKAALHDLDTAPLQVFLEASIAEVTLTDDMKYGLQYSFQPDANNQLVLTNTASPVIASVLPGFSYVFTYGNSIKVILSAIASKTHVEVISSPKLLVLNNQTASLQVGDRVPIVTQQAVSTITAGAPLVNSVQYEDTGVILKLTPRVNRGGLVMLDITQEVSDVATTTSSGIDSPTIHERKINSSVAIQDSETVALGGLIVDNRGSDITGIPFLQDIPVLGNLFRTTHHDDTKTELIVLITPHVVDSVSTARMITDELRRKLPAVQPLLSRAP